MDDALLASRTAAALPVVNAPLRSCFDEAAIRYLVNKGRKRRRGNRAQYRMLGALCIFFYVGSCLTTFAEQRTRITAKSRLLDAFAAGDLYALGDPWIPTNDEDP